jgi:hypothetical protein
MPGSITGGSTLPALFSTYRTVYAGQSQTAPATVYNLPATAGTYALRLFFAEVYYGATRPLDVLTSRALRSPPSARTDTCTVGARVFDVLINGAVALSRFDACAFAAVRTGARSCAVAPPWHLA